MDFDKPKNDLLNAHKTGAENNDNSDIQNKFYAWFEKKGLINNTQAHVREQMITALKNGPLWNANTVNSSSPKVQAFNLLVADFLLNRENVFTLSVFITEVPLLGNLHEFSSYGNRLGGNIQNGLITKPNYQLNVVRDILESLGFQQNSDVTELTCQYYFNDENNQIHPLIVCLFKAIITTRNNLSGHDKVQSNINLSNKSTNVDGDTNYEHRLNNWLASVDDILINLNINETQTNTLKKLLKRYHHNYNTQEANVYKERLKKLNEKNSELGEKVTGLERMLATHFYSRDSSILSQNEQIECAMQRLRSEQQQLYKSISIFEEKTKSTQEKLNMAEKENNKKLQDIENQKYALSLKEMEILKREKMLKEESTMNKTKTIESNQITYLQEQNFDLAKQLQEIKLKLVELENFKQIEQINSKKIDNDLQRIESSLDREMIRKIQRENDELREFIKIQQLRIEELSNRAYNLTKQIEKAHQILPTTTDYQTRNVKKKIHFVDETNKKKSSYTNQNISSTTTDYSTTVLESDNQTEDDMIKKAHSRLKILEINTSKAEKNFQTNHKHHYTDKVFPVVNKKSYSDIRLNLSDDSDLGGLKSSKTKLNLKELANKIKYQRSMRRYMNLSQSENDMNPGISQNFRLRDYTNVTNISPIKQPSSSDVNNMYSKSPVNRTSPITMSPINRQNHHIELSVDGSNISFNQSQMETVIVNKPSNTNTFETNDIENQIQTNVEVNRNNNNDVQNEDDISLQLFNRSENNDILPKQTSLRQDDLNEVDILSTSKKDTESDQTISFGSNKTNKSLDFWA